MDEKEKKPEKVECAIEDGINPPSEYLESCDTIYTIKGAEMNQYQKKIPKFHFRNAKLRNPRKIISLYIFKSLINQKKRLSDLVLHLKSIDSSAIILNLRELFNSSNLASVNPIELNFIFN